MANKINPLNLVIALCLSALLSALWPTAGWADESSSIRVKASSNELTPGQQFEIRLTAVYDDGVEMTFNPGQQSWLSAELLNYEVSETLWQENQWVTIYVLQVAAPLAGDYQLPALKVNFYRGADHWAIESQRLSYTVLSVFIGPPELQSLLSLPASTSVAPINPMKFYRLTPLFLVLLLGVGWYFSIYRRKPLEIWNTPLSNPEHLAQQAMKTGMPDWEALRLWLIVESGSDPLGKLTSSEPLLYQYQQLRFKHSSDVFAYRALCGNCLERWG